METLAASNDHDIAERRVSLKLRYLTELCTWRDVGGAVTVDRRIARVASSIEFDLGILEVGNKLD